MLMQSLDVVITVHVTTPFLYLEPFFSQYIFVFYGIFTQNCRATNIAQGCLILHEVIKLLSRGQCSNKVSKGHNCNIDESAILEQK